MTDNDDGYIFYLKPKCCRKQRYVRFNYRRRIESNKRKIETKQITKSE